MLGTRWGCLARRLIMTIKEEYNKYKEVFISWPILKRIDVSLSAVSFAMLITYLLSEWVTIGALGLTLFGISCMFAVAEYIRIRRIKKHGSNNRTT